MTTDRPTTPEAEPPIHDGPTPVEAAADPEGDGAEAPAPPSTVTQPPSTEPAPTEPSPTDKLADALAEATRLRDQLLRTAADFDNFRKRTRRELEDATRRGQHGVVRELLPVFDNLERAATHAEAIPDTKSVADGLRMVLKQFVDTLEKIGIKRVQTVGGAFDPTVHEAIQHLDSAEHPAGVVLAEIQGGYAMGDQLVRAALVVVSKGPPSGEPAPS